MRVCGGGGERQVVCGWKRESKNLDLSSAHCVIGEVQSNESSYINSVNPHKTQCSRYSLISIWLTRNLTYGEIKRLPKSLQLGIVDPRLDCGGRAARDPSSVTVLSCLQRKATGKGTNQGRPRRLWGRGHQTYMRLGE